MQKFETVFRVICFGNDEFDAGEKAGSMLDLSRMEDDMVISCEDTRQVQNLEMARTNATHSSECHIPAQA